MAEELDINAVAAQFVQQNIESIAAGCGKVLKLANDKVRLHLDRTYRQYLECVLDKYSRAKSFFIRGEAVYLYQFYVPLSLRLQKKHLEKPTLNDIAKVSRCAAIVGTGGSGKTMMMRHLLVNSVLSKKSVPIFVELRQVNNVELSLDDLVFNTLMSFKFQFDKEYVDEAIKKGHFAFFFDGLDEVVQSKRAATGKARQDFARKNDKNTVVVSSRPDTELEGWPDFTLLHIEPLSLDLAHELVTKLPFDEEIKGRFLDDLRKGMFTKHQSFLSNPLLLSIMLLTYGQSASIPTKLNVFYNQAYEALFERHDALKGGYQRKRHTKLDIQDFARVFSAFCLQTYDKRQFELSHLEALERIEKACEITAIRCDKTDYLRDATQAVSLLVEDGLMIVFAHRSFQEYFTARFISDAAPAVQESLIERYAEHIRTDNVLKLLHEMRPELVEKHYIIPQLAKYFNQIGVKKKIGKKNYLRHIKLVYSSFECRCDEVIGAHNGRSYGSEAVIFTVRNCGHLVGWSGFKAEEFASTRKHFAAKYAAGGDVYRIPTKKLTFQHPFLNDLASSPSVFSKKVLEIAHEILQVLQSNARCAEKSLEQILAQEQKVRAIPKRSMVARKLPQKAPMRPGV